MIETLTQDWATFYQKRVNSSYQDYFQKRYKCLIDIILGEKPSCIQEEGVGIGSISKALQFEDMELSGFDLCDKMLKLCQENNPRMFLFQDDILNPQFDMGCDLIVTHGVLEHFSDEEISCIFDRYNKVGVKNIHYVPTDGYTKQSFGDERLLPYTHWLEKFRPKDYLLFNDNKDLLIINL